MSTLRIRDHHDGDYCQSGFNPNVSDNLYEIVPPHEELSPAESDAPLF